MKAYKNGKRITCENCGKKMKIGCGGAIWVGYMRTDNVFITTKTPEDFFCAWWEEKKCTPDK